MIRLQILTTSVLLSFLSASAQECPKTFDDYRNLTGPELFQMTESKIFNSNVHKVALKIHRETEGKVLDDANRGVQGAKYGHVKEFCFYQKDSDATPEFCIFNAAYRVRGHNSRTRLKRQYKLKFDLANPSKVFDRWDRPWSPANPQCQARQNFYGLSALNLRSGGTGSNDDSMNREHLAGGIFARLSAGIDRGGPAYRTAHTKLYVSYCEGEEYLAESCNRTEYKGLYYLAEELDEVFLKARFQNARGTPPGVLISTAYENFDKRGDFFLHHFHASAYEANYVNLSSVQWKSAFAQELSFCEGHPGLAGKTGKAREGLLLMCATLKKLETLVATKNYAELGELFDLPNLYSYMAGVNFTGHWDSLMSNANNDYLYFNPNLSSRFGGKWQVLVWDLDNTIGSMNDYQMRTNHLDFSVREKNKLFEFIIQDNVLRGQFEQHYRKAISSMNRQDMLDQISRAEARVRSAIQGTWEESVGIDYAAAFRYLQDFVGTRYQRVRDSLGLH